MRDKPKNDLMARMINDKITGAVGNVIFYSMKGEGYVRSKPGKRKKKRGQTDTIYVSIFRLVSRYGTAMIKQMSNSFLFPFGRDMYNRLRGWMWNKYSDNHGLLQWKLQTGSPYGALNPESDLHDLLKVNIIITEDRREGIILSLAGFSPKKQIKAPMRTVEVNLKFIAVSCSFEKDVPRPGYSMQQLSFAYNDRLVPEQRIVLNTGAKSGDIVMVVVAMEYKISGQIGYSKDLRWLPAGVVGMGRVGG